MLHILNDKLQAVLVTASGNDASEGKFNLIVDDYPAHFLSQGVIDDMLVVGAVDGNNRRAVFSQTFPKDSKYPIVVHHAPGVNVKAPARAKEGDPETWDNYSSGREGTSYGEYNSILYR
jgi:hypothetical protein